MSTYALGLDLGGSSIKAVAITPAGQILTRRNVEFDALQTMDWARRIDSLTGEIQAECGAPAVAIGLSAPGLTAPDEQSIACMPGRLAGLQGLHWTSYLRSPIPVPVLNDAHAALAGETWLGAATGLRNVILLTLGTGVGGAAMVDGRLLKGHLGRAGHLGHICLDQNGPLDITRTPGSLEYFVGNYSIAERTGGRFQSTHALLAARDAGDPAAAEFWRQSIYALGCGIVSLVNVLDPEAVVIGGGIARAGEALFGQLAGVLDRIEWRPGEHRVKVLAARLGEMAGAIGAAGKALAWRGGLEK